MGRGSLCHASGGCPRRRRGDSCLSSVAALKAVAGGANGVFSCMGEGMAFYDMGTWDIESVLALEVEAERHGVRYVYMPLSLIHI